MLELHINGQLRRVTVDPQKPLLWVLREDLGLTGTKFSCGKGVCKSCGVHIDGRFVASCRYPVKRAVGKQVLTIEGLAEDPDNPLVQAWIETQVPQCGFCQSGQVMAAAALLRDNPRPSDDEITQAMNGVLCRCGTYPRIRSAIHRAVELADAS